VGNERLTKWCRAAANRTLSIAGYRKFRTDSGLGFFPKDAWGFDPWDDIARIHGSKSGPVTVLDVGANAGQTVANIKRRFPLAKVFSFEPDPRVFPQLVAVSKQFPGCSTFRFGLGAAEAFLDLQCAQASEGNSFLAVDNAITNEVRGGWNSNIGTTRVPVRRLDAVCGELTLSKIDILKIDVQGYELSVLEGAGSLLSPERIKSVLLEIGLIPIYENQATADQVFALLTTRGYGLISLYPSSRLRDGRMTWCDALFSCPA